MNALYQDLRKLCLEAEKNQQSANASDPFRQKFHLMPPVGWMNDVNGLCQFQGWYHVFYQYSPYNVLGGLKLWGHYRSKDLLHWEQLEPAIFPDTRFDLHGAYSGSAFAENGRLYLYYTGNVKLRGNYDFIYSGRLSNTMIAVSDDGITFPIKDCILSNADASGRYTQHVRDPKVWKENDTYYLMMGTRRTDEVGELLVLSSPNLTSFRPCLHLTTRQKLGYMWECPDLIAFGEEKFLSFSPQGVPAQGDRFQNLYQSGYLPIHGAFPSKESSLGDDFVEWDCGFDFYAPQTMTDRSGRILLFCWAGMAEPERCGYHNQPTIDRGWQHCMTMPRVLSHQNGRIYQSPTQELLSLRGECFRHRAQGAFGCILPRHADLELQNCGNADLTLTLFKGFTLTYRAEDRRITFTFTDDRLGCGRKERAVSVDALDSLSLFLDSSILEIFVNGGETVFTTRLYPQDSLPTLHAEGHFTLETYPMGAYDIQPTF